MIGSIQNYYNAPSPCLDLCAPLQKYQEFFVSQNAETTGFSKVALTIAWIATAFFAYPIFGLLAAVGVAIKIATCQQLAVDPVDMTDEQLRVWGQTPSVTTDAWNDVQLKRAHRLLHEGVLLAARREFDVFKASTYYDGTVSQGNPWVEEGILYDNWLWLRDDAMSGQEDSERIAEDIATILSNLTAEVQKWTAAGERIIFGCIYEMGGSSDPNNEGVAHIAAFPASSEADSAEVAPRDMTDEELKVWGQNPSVTTDAWNGVQMQRLGDAFNKGMELALEGKLTTSPACQGVVLEEDPWEGGGPWVGEALHNDFCFFWGENASEQEKAELALFNLSVAEALAGATAQGQRVEIRYLYQVGGEKDQTNEGIIYINCRIIQ